MQVLDNFDDLRKIAPSQVLTPSTDMIFTGKLMPNLKNPQQPRVHTSWALFPRYSGFLDDYRGSLKHYSSLPNEPRLIEKFFYRFVITGVNYKEGHLHEGEVRGIFFTRPLRMLDPSEHHSSNLVSPREFDLMRKFSECGRSDLIIENDTIMRDFEHFRRIFSET